ncbi:hypothetical protein AB0872_20590 [Microbacterium sp. NPDC047426]
MDPERLITAGPALIFGAVIVIAAIYAVTYSVRGGEHRTRSGIRRLEKYANHPGGRRLHTDPREENPQP